MSQSTYQVQTQDVTPVPGLDARTRDYIFEHAKTNPFRCLQCRTCSAGCPFIESMDFGPHRIVRLLQFGFVDQALTSTTIWICVGCDTCAGHCPAGIDIPALMDALREQNLASDIPPALPGVVALHQEIVNSMRKYGRTHKLEIMLRYKIGQKAWLQDMDVGMKMLAKRKLHLWPSKIQGTQELRNLLNRNKERGHE